MNPQESGDIDSSSPAHWAAGTMHVFFSTGHPFRSSGPDLFHLSRPSQRVSFDNEATWKMGPRWIEATHKARDGKLYMWYHNEPPVPGGRTAPRIGEMVSTDDGLHGRDLGIVVEAPPGSNNSESVDKSVSRTDRSQKPCFLRLPEGCGGPAFRRNRCGRRHFGGTMSRAISMVTTSQGVFPCHSLPPISRPGG